MTDKLNGKAFIKLPLELLASDAWRSLSINARRFIDFVMIEHMRHGGKANGRLLAPRRQLEEFGIGARHVSAAIEEAVRGGFVNCHRGTGRQPSLYALTWFPLGDGIAVVTSEGKHVGYPKGSHKARSDFRREVTKPQIKGIRREAPSKKASYRRKDLVLSLEKRVGTEVTDSSTVSLTHAHAREPQFRLTKERL
jgi:hypothetical protein